VFEILVVNSETIYVLDKNKGLGLTNSELDVTNVLHEADETNVVLWCGFSVDDENCTLVILYKSQNSLFLQSCILNSNKLDFNEPLKVKSYDVCVSTTFSNQK
jgi:hypothetical protein